MRTVLLVGLVIALLVVGILVVKNMGGDSSGEMMESRARQAIERAEDASDLAGEQVRNIQDQLQESD